MSRLVLKEALFVMITLIPAAAADYNGYYSGYYGSSGYGRSEPIVSLSLDPQENLNNGFRLAARQDRLDELQSYLKEGAELNSVSEDGETALIISARSCSTKLVRFLLESKADVNRQDKLGRTALMFAAGDGCLPVVDRLIAVPGIKVRLRDRENKTALDYAGYDFRIADRLHAVAHARHRARQSGD